MFTGIVTDVGKSSSRRGPPGRLRLPSTLDPADIALGASIACRGPCLTVIAVGSDRKTVPGSRSTPPPKHWTAPRWATGAGRRINLERSLKIGDELGGHIVTGHVDGVADVRRPRRDHGAGGGPAWGPTARFTIHVPARSASFIAEKGSVCLDGMSLTVNSVEGDLFSVLMIPHTLAVTTWGALQAGDSSISRST